MRLGTVLLAVQNMWAILSWLEQLPFNSGVLGSSPKWASSHYSSFSVRAAPGRPQYHNEIRLVRLRPAGHSAHIRPKHRLQRLQASRFLPAELSMMVVVVRRRRIVVPTIVSLCRQVSPASSPDLTHRYR